MTRKVTQIATIPETFSKWGKLFSLCDDGTIWRMTLNGADGNWVNIPDVPQDESENGWISALGEST